MTAIFDNRLAAEFTAEPLLLVDVGARGGLKADWKPLRPYLRVVSFEPDPQEFAALAADSSGTRGDVVLPYALGERAGRLSLHLTKDRGLSSIYLPNRAFLDSFPDAERWDVDGKVDVDASTLDEVLAAHSLSDLDFLKVDAQGSELAILRGGSEVLREHAIGIEVEVEFASLYEGQPLFAEVDAFARSLGFALFDLRPCYWKRSVGRNAGGPFGQIVWADALYLKTDHALEASLKRRASGTAAHKLLKALSVVASYGYADYALHLLATLDVSSLGERAAWVREALLNSTAGRPPLPEFPGKGVLGSAARRAARALSDPRGGWSVGKGRIGNER